CYRCHLELPCGVTRKVEEEQRFTLCTGIKFDFVQYLRGRDLLATDDARLIGTVPAKKAMGHRARKCARRNPCSNLLPSPLVVGFLWTVRRHSALVRRSVRAQPLRGEGTARRLSSTAIAFGLQPLAYHS